MEPHKEWLFLSIYIYSMCVCIVLKCSLVAERANKVEIRQRFKRSSSWAINLHRIAMGEAGEGGGTWSGCASSKIAINSFR